MWLRGRLRNPRGGLFPLVLCLSASCVQVDAPVETGAPAESLAVSRSREKMRINDDGIIV
jgi:hypothetical protein